MEIILREDVPALGKSGDVVKVADGFGRNYLFPHKKAILANKANLKRLEEERQAIATRREKTRKEAEEQGQKIASLKVSLSKQAGEENKIFGSVSTREIAAALAALGIPIDKRLIRIREAIRKLGSHTVELHLHGDVVVPLTIQVVKK